MWDVDGSAIAQNMVLYVINFIFPQMWDVDGSAIAAITAVGTGVRPCTFFKDNICVISSQIGSVLVRGRYILIVALMYVCCV